MYSPPSVHVRNYFFLAFVDLESAEELYNKRITRILTADFPHYFAVVTRIRQETKTIGPESGMLSSTVVPQVQAVFPEGSLTKKIKVGLQVGMAMSVFIIKIINTYRIHRNKRT